MEKLPYGELVRGRKSERGCFCALIVDSMLIFNRGEGLGLVFGTQCVVRAGQELEQGALQCAYIVFSH